jgi:hypothetical protein
MPSSQTSSGVPRKENDRAEMRGLFRRSPGTLHCVAQWGLLIVDAAM